MFTVLFRLVDFTCLIVTRNVGPVHADAFAGIAVLLGGITRVSEQLAPEQR